MITTDVVEAVVIWHGAKWREATASVATPTEPRLRVDPPKPLPPRRVIRQRWSASQPILDALVGWMTSADVAQATGLSGLQVKNGIWRLKSLGLVQMKRDYTARTRRCLYARVQA